MVDVIANDQELLRMQNAAKTADILRKLDFDIGTYDLSDTSSENVKLLEDTEAKMSLAGIHADICLKAGGSCILNNVAHLPKEVNSEVNKQNEVAGMLGYTAGDADTASIIAKVKNIKAKGESFDASFQYIAGTAPSGSLAEDAKLFAQEALVKSLKSVSKTNLEDIGKKVFDNSGFSLNEGNAGSIADAVEVLYEKQVHSSNNANQTLIALGARAISASPTQIDVLSKVTTFIDNIKKLNARAGVKTSDYEGKTVADVITDIAIPNLKLMFNYQSVIVAIQYACNRVIGASHGGAPAERVSFHEACNNLLDANTPNTLLKTICTNTYYNNGGTIQTVGSSSTGYVMLPEFVSTLCESFSGMKNIVTGEIISIDYADAISSPEKWQDFINNAGFFDDISSSAVTWADFYP